MHKGCETLLTLCSVSSENVTHYLSLSLCMGSYLLLLATEIVDLLLSSSSRSWSRKPRVGLYTFFVLFTSITAIFLKVLRNKNTTRNALDCNQSNYSSRIVFSHIPIEFGQTRSSTIRSADPENPTIEPNMKWIGRPVAEIWPFEIFPIFKWGHRLVGRSVVSRWSILNIYFFLHWSHILLFAMLGT